MMILMIVLINGGIVFLLDKVFPQCLLHVEMVESTGHVGIAAVHSSHWQEKVDV